MSACFFYWLCLFLFHFSQYLVVLNLYIIFNLDTGKCTKNRERLQLCTVQSFSNTSYFVCVCVCVCRWHAIIVDGHSVEELCKALCQPHDQPTVIVAQTLKGKGISGITHTYRKRDGESVHVYREHSLYIYFNVQHELYVNFSKLSINLSCCSYTAVMVTVCYIHYIIQNLQ